MPKGANQKRKLLHVMRLLLERSDETHPIPMPRLLASLEAQGIRAERKSVYDDLEALREFGLDIIKGPGGYYVGSRRFELPELKLLVDSVQSSKFITRRKTLSLIRKIESLASVHDAQLLQRQVYVRNRVKSMNESVYYSVDAIHTAISQARQISFRYFDYDSRKERVFRRDGAEYRVAPYCLIWDNANYYLVGREPGEEETRHYRVDKMDRVTVTGAHADVPRNFDSAAYVSRYFSMFSGKSAKVRLACPARMAGVILDRFGRETMLVPRGEGFTATLDVVVSPQFWGWLAGLGPQVRLEGPDWAAQEYRAYLQSLLDA